MNTSPTRRPQAPHLSVAPTPRRVADVIVDTLRDLGVDLFLGVCGGAVSPMYDALLDANEDVSRSPVKVIHNRHESAALFIAAGASLMGRLPCVLVTSGPGITNALTGIASAFADSIPLIVIGGEVAKKNFGRGALQEGSKYELDTVAIVRSVTKYQAPILNPRAASSVVRRAVQTALSGRQGPVFLSLPLDVASERVTPTVISSNVATHFAIDDALLERAAALLRGHKKGLILVGSGARHPVATTQIRIMAEQLRMPVMTTPKGKGLFPESSPLHLGIFGYGGHPSATKYLEQEPDIVLAIGCGLGETSTNGWTPLIHATSFIQIDIDSSQIGKNYHVDIGLVGAAHQVLPSLLAKIRDFNPEQHFDGVVVHQPELMDQDRIPLHPARVVKLLQTCLPHDTIFTSDIGEHLMFALHYLKLDRPDSFIGHLGLGSMGSGIGSAIGAKMAAPSRPVVGICGDFGFQMFGMELATCVQYGVGTIFAIMNDGRMGMVENGFERVYGRGMRVDAPAVDFAAMARSVGAIGITIRTPVDFNQLTPELVRGDVPVVLDIHIDPTARFAVSGRDQTLGTFASKNP
ncbi:MAG: thiamine pyrophosphate-binding protein [Myxococcota bacterium]